MANLKLIKVTGSPFCDTLYGCIGIQRGDTVFEVIKGGGLNLQGSSSGSGWRYATAEEIAENWKLIYPHWTPEPGDNVIVTQDYDDWTNCRCTILEKDKDDTTYYRVKKESGRMSTFNYTSQMILAPTTSSIPDTSTTITETKSESSIGWKWQDLKVGDKVKIIGGDFSSRPVGSIFTIKLMEDKDYLGKQPIRLIDSDGEDKGWPHISTFEPYYGDIKTSEPSEPEKETMHKFKIGDRVKCINSDIRGYGKIGTILAQSNDTSDTSVGVEFDENIDGHTLDGRCPMDRGWWIFEKDLELASDSKPKSKSSFELGDYVKALEGPFVAQVGVIRELKGGRFGVEFSEKSRSGGHDLNGKCKDGYGWYYGSTEIVAASSSASIGVVESTFSVDSQPKRKFKVGDKVTYKSKADCGNYYYGGEDQGGFVGTVESEMSYVSDKGCYSLKVTTKEGDYTYGMLESEFHEYDFGYAPITSGAIGSSESATRLVIKGSSAAADGNHIFVDGVAYPISHYSSNGSTHSTIASIDSDPLSSYKQKPIIIKQKPKTKLTTI